MKFKTFMASWTNFSKLDQQLNEFSKTHEIKAYEMNTISPGMTGHWPDMAVLVAYEDLGD